MKKENTIRRLVDFGQLNRLVEMHKEIFMNTVLQDKLIYFDENFPHYLKTVLLDKNQYIFGVFTDNEINGFLHFKKYNESLFLNNIFIGEKIRGRGIGTEVLNTVLRYPFVMDEGMIFLELDVLQSNSGAKKWYEKLGLSEVSKDIWYFINNPRIDRDLNPHFEIATDDNNFNSLFYNKEKVATIINDFYIIVHNKLALEYPSIKTFVYKEMARDESIQYPVVDCSIRMKGTISQIIDKLGCLHLK
ncbi:GNAT family N-acetyltransferase [Chryseobacterium sp. LC2016-27]|uniref:GNAT family N-acetyltransferase n=1 Tax=Chryseobacterium sp. LC2016-27 TaxID=2897326 RepID=UPI001E365A8D|nr:GNAT family N-acetyltransferase [Chryseobacterium sp. LC2016-27]MCD0457549.1 GNAT family N-acetyltransferase [Chryseobacterium sp. LC2016-27]